MNDDKIKSLAAEYVKEYYHGEQPWVSSEIINFLGWPGKTHIVTKKDRL